MSQHQTSLYASDNEKETGINIEKLVSRQGIKKENQQSPNTDTSPFSSIKVTPIGHSPNEANAQVLTGQSTKGIPL